jgi:integrase
MARDPKPWYREDRGAWYVTIRGKRHNLGPDKKDAKDRFNDLMADKTPVAASGSVWAILDAFLDWTKDNKSEGTYGWYRDKLQSFKDGMPDVQVSKIDTLAVEEWLRTKTTWGPTVKNGMVTALRRAFNWAVKKRVLQVNPLLGLEKPEAQRRERVISQEEYDAILALANDECFRDLLIIAWTTGARPQELIKIEARHLQANKTVMFPKGEAKGKKRARVIFPPDETVALLVKWAERNPTGPILRNQDGKPWKAFAIGCRFYRMKNKLGCANI